MTTWASRHPWFNPPTLKRKLRGDDSDDDSSSSETPPSRWKRLRHDSLERTLAHMTLGNALAAPAEDVDMWPRTSPGPRPPRVQETLNVVLPSSIEEPAASDSDMEVELTPVATDMPFASNDWDSVKSEQLDIKEIQISSAALECLKRQTSCPLPLVPLSARTSQALVLYRTPRAPSIPVQQACDDQPQIVCGDDVMEVE